MPEPDNDIDLIEKVDDERLKEQLNGIVAFNGYLSPGAVIGVFMMNYACEILGCAFEDDIFAIVETYNCLPDAATALARWHLL
jgi:formylmethanofuran dehydrogenase subunit E